MLWYRRSIAVLSTLMIVIGFVLLVRGALDGKTIGLVVGALFVAVGAGRLHLLRRR